MSKVREACSRLAGLFRKSPLEERFDAEVRFHVEMLAADYERRGLPPDEARRAALREFGGVTQMKETYRDQGGLPFVETLLQDVRYGARTLVRTPGFTVAALVTLALGIGANSAIFSVINAVLLRPLPYHEPDRIAALGRTVRGSSEAQLGSTGLQYLFYREHLRSVEALTAWHGIGFNLATETGGEYVLGRAVSKEYFTVFPVRPLHGTLFTAEHDVVGGPMAAILSHGLWQRQFASNPGVIGSTVHLAEEPYTVLGVMPPDYEAMSASPVDVYIPLRPRTTGSGSGFNYSMTGRLKPGVSLEQARADAQVAFDAFRQAHPEGTQEWETGMTFIPYQDSLTRTVKPALLLMLGAVAMLLLIACANTAGLLLARATGRGREVAVRAALGANRLRIVRQLLTESLLLSLLGGALGLLLAYWTVPSMLALLPAGFPLYRDVQVDLTVLLTTLGIALVTGVLFGLAPALSLSRHDLVEAFKDDATRTTSSRRSGLARQALVVGEVAVCLLLLVAAGLLLQTFLTLRAVDPGFDVAGVMTARTSLHGERYSPRDALNRYISQGIERLQRIPGVESVALVNGVPIERGLNLNVTIPDGPLQGEERVENAVTDWRFATHNYFETMGIPIVAGRGFDDRDTAGSPRVTVVNEEFVRRFFRGANPVGHLVTVLKKDPPMEIVGVLQDVREAGLVGPSIPVMYVPVVQVSEEAAHISNTYFPVSWVVRARNLGPRLVDAMRQELRAVDPQQPISAFRSMEEVKSAQFQNERFQMTLLLTLAGIGLLLAAAGIYGLISYSVAQRTREFAIRIALGAKRGQVLGLVLRHATLLALVGIGIGIVAAFTLSKTLQAVLFGTATLDAVTCAAVAGLLLIVALLAGLVPALRAVRLNPIAALRE